MHDTCINNHDPSNRRHTPQGIVCLACKSQYMFRNRTHSKTPRETTTHAQQR